MKKVIIIGPKNVGKSSLFNILTKSNKSSVIDYAGYTRDVNKSLVKFDNFVFELIDTAGIGYEKSDIDFMVFKKTWEEIKFSDIIIILSDVFNFNNIFSKNIVNILKNFKQDKIFVINKADLLNYEDTEFYKKKNFFLISVKKNIGIKNLINNIVKFLDSFKNSFNSHKNFFVSIIGKVNSGKSSLANSLSGSSSALVYDEDGTTRDNIKIDISDKKYYIIDTPGVKKYTNISNNLNKFQINKNLSILNGFGISILNIDATIEISKLDLFFLKKKKSSIIVFNKCDLVSKKQIEKIELIFKKNFRFNKKFVYNFLSSKYNFGIYNLSNKINNIIYIYNKFLKFKNIDKINIDVLRFSNKINFINIEKIFPLRIKISLSDKKTSEEYKKFITFLIIKEFDLKSFFFDVIFI